MTLPDLLTRAARLMPERFKVETDGNGNQHFYAWAVVNGGHFAHVHVVSKHHEMHSELGGMYLRTACEQECAARRWANSVDLNNSWNDPKRAAGATVFRSGDGPSFIHLTFAPTPAHALLAALVEAVEAEEAQA